MVQRSYRWLFVTFALVGLVADQASKYGMWRWLGNDEGRNASLVVFADYLKLEVNYAPGSSPVECPLVKLNGPVAPHVNQGALFGLFVEHRDRANLLFMGISILAAVAISWWAVRRAARNDGLLLAALGLILAGTLGNLYDRAVFNGVRDFIHFYITWANFDWPVFNIADCCLVCGAGLLLFQATFTKAAKQPAGEPGENLAQELKASGVV